MSEHPAALNRNPHSAVANTGLYPAAPYMPYGTSTPLRVPKAPAKQTPGPAGSKGSIGKQWAAIETLAAVTNVKCTVDGQKINESPP